MKRKIKIAITDNEELFRKGIRTLLEREDDFKILFEANNNQELIEQISPDRLPDIILMDVKTPISKSVKTLKIIHKKHPSIRIIALTSYSNKFSVLNMINNGAAAYLLKNTNFKTVVKTIKNVFKEGIYYDDMVSEIINEYNLNSKKINQKVKLHESSLSKREHQILELICSQLTSSEIAQKLNISRRTVDGHRNRMLLKTASKNIAGLVIYGIKQQLIEVNT